MKAVELKEIVREKMEKAINEAFEELEKLETEYGYKEVNPKLVADLEEASEELANDLCDGLYTVINYRMYE